MIFQGANFKNEEEIQFRLLDVEYSHLYEWLGLSGIDLAGNIYK